MNPLDVVSLPQESDASVARLQLAMPEWPRNVPSTRSAMTLMFDVQRLPASLQVPTLDLLNMLTERNLSSPPEGVAIDQWLGALAITWRYSVRGVFGATG